MPVRLQLTIFIHIVAILCCASRSDASTYIPVGDDVYSILSRLEAEGTIKTGLLSTKPISRKEAIRLLHEAESADPAALSPYLRSLMASLRQRLRLGQAHVPSPRTEEASYRSSAAEPAAPRSVEAAIPARFAYANSDIQALNYNNDGDTYDRGLNARLGLDLRADDLGPYSFHIEPEYRWSEDHELLRFRRAYAVADIGWDLVLGKDSQWWGPGYHGAILLSNNAEPFTMARIVNDEPFTLPWLLKYLGPLRFTFFVTNLEHDRTDVPDPYLYGMRFNFRPHAMIELGLQKTALLGGRGRSESLSVWWNSFVSTGEHGDGESGDQRAGFDVKVTLPFHRQPVQIYMDAAAEDSVHLRPVQWAYVYGLYLPRLLSLEQVGFRFEWSNTYDKAEPSSWYQHHIFTDGYTFRKRVIGYHMGTNSRDTFMELTVRMPGQNARIALAYDIEEHAISTPVREKKHELSLGGVFQAADRMELQLSYANARIKNLGNVQRETLGVNLVVVEAAYRF